MGLDEDCDQKTKKSKHDRQAVSLIFLCCFISFWYILFLSFYWFPSPEFCQTRQHKEQIQLLSFGFDEGIINPLCILNASDV